MKKFFAVLLAALLFVTLMAGCSQTKDYIISVDEEGETEVGDVVKTKIRTRKVTTVGNQQQSADTGKTKYTTFQGQVTRTRAQGEKSSLKYTLLDDAGANYKVKGRVSIAVDTTRPTDSAAMFDVMQDLYPNIQFTFDYWASTLDRATEYLTTRMSTGTAADIIWDDAGNMPFYIKNDWVYPITDYVAKDPEAKNIPANLKKDYTFCGELYAVSSMATFMTLCFNMDLMKQLNLKMPALEWSLDDMENILRSSVKGFNDGACVGMVDLFEIDDIANYYYANESSSKANYGDLAYNYDTRQVDVQYMYKGLLLFRKWRMMGNGTEGWFAAFQRTGDQHLLSQKLGVADYTTLWRTGKALMEYSNTGWVDQGVLGVNTPFTYVQHPCPNKDGNLMFHVNQCWITTAVDKENLDAAFQALRFMTYTTNGNLVRLAMYDDANKGKYALNSSIFYPVTSNKAVLDKFNSLSVTGAFEEYLQKNIPNSRRHDTFKLQPLEDLQAEFGDWINSVTDGTGTLEQGEELAAKVNKKIANEWAEFEATVKKNQAKYK